MAVALEVEEAGGSKAKMSIQRHHHRGGSSARIRRDNKARPEPETTGNPGSFQTFQNAWFAARLAGIPHPGKMACPSCGSYRGHEIRIGVSEYGREWVSDCRTCGKIRNAWALVMLGRNVDYDEAKRIVQEGAV